MQDTDSDRHSLEKGLLQFLWLKSPESNIAVGQSGAESGRWSSWSGAGEELRVVKTDWRMGFLIRAGQVMSLRRLENEVFSRAGQAMS